MARVLVIGGGAIGLSLAYHLSRRAGVNVTLMERNQLTSGTSWHAAGIVGPSRATANSTRLAMYAGELLPALEAECGLSTGYRQTGGYWLARDPARMDELHRIAALGRHLGLTPLILDASEVDVPGLDLDGVTGALKVREDAHVNPVDLCMAYAKAARTEGAVIHENAPVERLLIDGSRVRGVLMADGREILADRVALCAGVWSKKLAGAVGVALPLQAVEHMYVVTEPMSGLPKPYPVLRDLDRGIYIKGDAGRLLFGGFEPNAKCWDAVGPEGDHPFLVLPEDWDHFMPFMQAALALIPALANTGIQHFMNGPESFSIDTRPLIGETPEVDGLYVAAGMNSVGIMSSAGIGRVLADWMVDGAAPMDLWEVDIARVDPLTAADEHVRTRMEEAVSDTFALHFPFKQATAGRGLRKSALHDRWAAAGAQFGLTAGWERALWYAEDASETGLPYSTGPQPWQTIVYREAAIMQTGTAMIDLSPFGKFDITGPDAPALMQYLAAADMDVTVGRAVYTPLLNERGGVEADVTVARIGIQHFRMTSGGATRAKDFAWLRRHGRHRNVAISDMTDKEVVIGVMGAGARSVLESLSDDDWQQFPFATTRAVSVAGTGCRAIRISFVGEPGWELHIPNDRGGRVFDALQTAGARPMGHYAVEGCRLEKGFKHWGHDLGPDITPLEAGLGFTIAWHTTFLGKDALSMHKAAGPIRRAVLFDLPEHPLILHDEPIWERGHVVGLTTSGARGARTRKTLALGLIDIVAGETPRQTEARNFHIEVAGQLFRAIPLMRPPFDPSGHRMNA